MKTHKVYAVTIAFQTKLAIAQAARLLNGKTERENCCGRCLEVATTQPSTENKRLLVNHTLLL